MIRLRVLRRRSSDLRAGPKFAPVSKPSRVVIIGAGAIGSQYAYTLLLQGIAGEICLLDTNVERARAEALDLSHTVPLARRAEVWAGTFDDIAGADVMIAAGAPRKQAQTGTDLLRENARIVGDIAGGAGAMAPDAVYLVATMPVDVMAYVTMMRSGVHHSHVLGCGTLLDTSLLRHMASRRLGVAPHDIQALVVGEHGPSGVVAWSQSGVAGTDLDRWPELDGETRHRLTQELRSAAHELMTRKGGNSFAEALALARVTEAVLRDTRTVFPVSSYLQGEYGIRDVYVGVPSVVGREGVLRTIEVPLSESERRRLRQSAEVIADTISTLELEKTRPTRLVPALVGQGLEISDEFVTGSYAGGRPGSVSSSPPGRGIHDTSMDEPPRARPIRAIKPKKITARPKKLT
jgi:L-lactate dehydrogenase